MKPLLSFSKCVIENYTSFVSFRLMLGLTLDSDFFWMITVVLASEIFAFLFYFAKTVVKSISPHYLAYESSNSLKTVLVGFGSSFLTSSPSGFFSV